MPEILIRLDDYAKFESILRREPAHGNTFDEASIKHSKKAIARSGVLTAAINRYRALFYRNPLTLKRMICCIETPTLVIWVNWIVIWTYG